MSTPGASVSVDQESIAVLGNLSISYEVTTDEY